MLRLIEQTRAEREARGDRVAGLFPPPETTEWNVRDITYDRSRRAKRHPRVTADFLRSPQEEQVESPGERPVTSACPRQTSRPAAAIATRSSLPEANR